jgi:hypothetical protein
MASETPSKFHGDPATYIDWRHRMMVKFTASGCRHHVETMGTHARQEKAPIEPTPLAANANSTVRANYRFEYSNWQTQEKTWREADLAGMKLIDEHCSESIKQNYFADRTSLYEQVKILDETFLPAPGSASMIPEATRSLWKEKIKAGYNYNGTDTLRSFIMTTENYLKKLGILNVTSKYHDLFEKIEDSIMPRKHLLGQIQGMDSSKPMFYPLYGIFKTFKDSHSGVMDEIFYRNMLEKLCTEDEALRSSNIYVPITSAVTHKSSAEHSAVMMIDVADKRVKSICGYCVIEGHSTDECRTRKCKICGDSHLTTKCFKITKMKSGHGNHKKWKHGKFNNRNNHNHNNNNANNNGTSQKNYQKRKWTKGGHTKGGHQDHTPKRNKPNGNSADSSQDK